MSVRADAVVRGCVEWATDGAETEAIGEHRICADRSSFLGVHTRVCASLCVPSRLCRLSVAPLCLRACPNASHRGAVCLPVCPSAQPADPALSVASAAAAACRRVWSWHSDAPASPHSTNPTMTDKRTVRTQRTHPRSPDKGLRRPRNESRRGPTVSAVSHRATRGDFVRLFKNSFRARKCDGWLVYEKENCTRREEKERRQ